MYHILPARLILGTREEPWVSLVLWAVTDGPRA